MPATHYLGSLGATRCGREADPATTRRFILSVSCKTCLRLHAQDVAQASAAREGHEAAADVGARANEDEQPQ